MLWASQVELVVENLSANAGDVRETGSIPQKIPLEKGTATNTSILAWRIPMDREPHRLQSMGCQRVGHDWSSLAHTHYKIYNGTNIAVLCLVVQSCPTLCKPMDCSLPGFSAHGDSTGKNTGVGCHAFPQWHIL